jgi:hypothetical protein
MSTGLQRGRGCGNGGCGHWRGRRERGGGERREGSCVGREREREGGRRGRGGKEGEEEGRGEGEEEGEGEREDGEEFLCVALWLSLSSWPHSSLS